MLQLSNDTPESIRDRIFERMSTTLQTREGSVLFDVIGAVAFELWRHDMMLDELTYAFYVNEDSGIWLDEAAKLKGMSRRQGTKATALIHFVGKDGTSIPAGTLFYTAAGLEFILAADVVISDGAAEGVLEAAEVGSVYNVAAGEIEQIYRNISGVESYTNDQALGGTDQESDAALFLRIDDARKNPATGGNAAYYRNLALSCEGIGVAKVTGLWAGPGTLRVLLAGYDYEPVDQLVVDACDAYIQENRFVGADVTVVSASSAPVAVAATVVLDITTTAEIVQAEFVSKLGTYCKELAAAYFDTTEIQDYPLYYNKIAALLMGIDGVVDFTALTVNGGTDTVMVDGSSVPEPGKVTVII